MIQSVSSLEVLEINKVENVNDNKIILDEKPVVKKQRRRRRSSSRSEVDYSSTKHRHHKPTDNYTNIIPQQMNPQMVPIQTFSFFKWQINVDTLVRLFILA